LPLLSRLLPALTALCLMTGSALANPAFLADGDAQTLSFDILRKGQVIGGHTTVFVPRAGGVAASTTAWVKVKVLGITVYAFDMRETELWEADRLVDFTTTSNDDGARHAAAGKAAGDGLALMIDGQAHQAPALPVANLWRMLPEGEIEAIDPADGKPGKLVVRELGRETISVRGRAVPARHWTWEGDMARELWYDDADRLIQVRLRGDDGSQILYVAR
jgi:D-arabinose 1-dehydrogenase-like Zn-dependent alcohol dehydrogenase